MLAAFSHFFALFQASGGILAFFIKFLRFGIDFGWVGDGFGRGLGRFWEGFFDDFSCFCQEWQFRRNHCFTVVKTLFLSSRALKKYQKLTKIHWKINAILEMEKIELKIGKKLDLRRSWARFEKNLGLCEASFGRSWATLGQFWRVQNRAFFQHGPKMGSKRPSGQIWAGFGKVWERFWEGWERCSTALLLHLISCAYCLSSIGNSFC